MSTMQERFVRETKRKLFEIISQDDEVFVGVNLEHEGVRLPEWLKQGDPHRPQVQSSLRVLRLEVNEEGVSQTLRFGGEYFPVFVAWDAIFVISEEREWRHGAWPFHAPKALQPREEEVRVQLDKDTQVILTPDGAARQAKYLN